MAFYDWNRNGKTDMQDMFLEYNIFKACTEDDDEEDEYAFDSYEDIDELDEFLDKK